METQATTSGVTHTPFKDLAKNIIKKNIKTAVYIDDKIAMPFSSTLQDGVAELCANIYENFQNQSILLDFVPFTSGNDYSAKLTNRDLLVVDWHLNGEGGSHDSTLSIIEQAIERENLHFMCIYTQTNEINFTDIWCSIFNYFKYTKKDIEDVLTELEEKGMKYEDLASYADSTWKLLNSKDANELKELKTNFHKEHQELGKIWSKILLEKLCVVHLLNKNYKAANKRALSAYNIEFVDTHTVLINSTFITIINKRINKELFDKITDAMLGTSHSILTWMGIELHNTLSDMPKLLPDELNSDVELAFHAHYKTLETSEEQEEFISFLQNLWVSQLNGYIKARKSEFSESEILESYFRDKSDEVDTSNLQKSMNLLSYYWNISSWSASGGEKIGFGDIFKVSVDTEEIYLLCVTPHCDYANPSSKILHYYSFIRGVKVKPVSDAEQGYYSFIRENTDGDEDKTIITIDWNSKTYPCKTIPIQIDCYSKNCSIKYPKATRGTVSLSETKLIYIGTLKENYAQRMANHAGGHNIRVGVNFAKAPKE